MVSAAVVASLPRPAGVRFGAAQVWRPASLAESGDYSAPVWFPLRHSLSGGKIVVGCTYLSYGGQYGYDCNGYHPWWALDLGAEIGSPVYAAGAGFATIYSTGTKCGSTGYGNAVVVDHGSYGKTIYAHLSQIDVPSGGEWVTEDTEIGLVGNTGNADCSFPHLHFEHFVKTPGRGGDSMNPGELKACHGTSLLSYPASFGESTWQGIPWGKYHAYSDGIGCKPPPDGSGSNSRSPLATSDGYMFAMAIGEDGHLWYRWRQEGTGDWSKSWTDRGKPGSVNLAGSPSLVVSDGYMFAMAIGEDGHLWYRWRQEGTGDWSKSWTDRGKPGSVNLRPWVY
jgi:hypothetical protein